MKTTVFNLSLALGLNILPVIPARGTTTDPVLPNILWITSEDNSPMLGCYGDKMATTPNLDRLASEGFIYTHAYANAPVSAAVRNTIITGMYACSTGNQQMRSTYLKSDEVHFYPEYLRKAGYYCTNNAKTDYNIAHSQIKNVWDECNRKAHYIHRQPGQPFFAVFNTEISHESCLHRSIPAGKLRHKPEDVTLPPYHPDIPETRHDWAQYYDKLEDMDARVGKLLRELEANGELENTIIFYYGDHGGVLCRSKRFVYETGTHIPLIVRIPDKFRHLFPAVHSDSKVDRLVSAVDFPATLLSIAGIRVPEQMQGKPFLGKQKTPDPEYVYMFRNRMDERYDMTRAVRDKQFRYIRNYMPHRIYGQEIEYLWRAPSVPAWEKMYKEGKCNKVQSAFWETKPAEELYDTENDPWEVHNLAADPRYAKVLKRMRKACNQWTATIRDADFIPEGEYQNINKKMSLYDYMRSGEVPFKIIQETANMASDGKVENKGKLLKRLQHKDRNVRYWAATGLLILGDNVRSGIPALQQALHDESVSVGLVAAEALYRLGEKEEALEVLVPAINHPNQFVRVHALNIVDFVEADTPAIQKAVLALEKTGKNNGMRYDLDMVKRLKKRYGY